LPQCDTGDDQHPRTDGCVGHDHHDRAGIKLGDGARAEALRPVTWGDWITLPIRDGDDAVRTVHGAIRVPPSSWP